MKYLKLFENFAVDNKIKKGDRVIIKKVRDIGGGISVGKEFTGILKTDIEKSKSISLVDQNGKPIFQTSLVDEIHKTENYRMFFYLIKTKNSVYQITKSNPTTNSVRPKGSRIVNGKIIKMQGLTGTIDYTGFEKNTNLSTMPEFTKLISNWNLDFIKKGLMNYKGQYLFEYGGRVFVFLHVGKMIMPFYFSSKGTDGKKLDWHYVFGINSVPPDFDGPEHDWIIKGSLNSSGEMEFPITLKKMHSRAIAELEKVKVILRDKLFITPETRDEIVYLLEQLRSKYSKSLRTIFKSWNVVAGLGANGEIVTNENYDYLLNLQLTCIMNM